jgi:hypothetical protein
MRGRRGGADGGAWHWGAGDVSIQRSLRPAFVAVSRRRERDEDLASAASWKLQRVSPPLHASIELVLVIRSAPFAHAAVVQATVFAEALTAVIALPEAAILVSTTPCPVACFADVVKAAYTSAQFTVVVAIANIFAIQAYFGRQ